MSYRRSSAALARCWKAGVCDAAGPGKLGSAVLAVLESWGLRCWSAALSAFDGWRDPSRCAAPIVGSRFY